MPPAASKKPHAPATVEYEFGGPIGAAGIVLALPLLVLGLHILCNENGCLGIGGPGAWYQLTYAGQPISSLSLWASNIYSDLHHIQWWSNEAFMVVVGWLALHAVLLFVIPGPIVNGVASNLAEYPPLPYKINGMLDVEIHHHGDDDDGGGGGGVGGEAGNVASFCVVLIVVVMVLVIKASGRCGSASLLLWLVTLEACSI
jgi:hypothetical protein